MDFRRRCQMRLKDFNERLTIFFGPTAFRDVSLRPAVASPCHRGVREGQQRRRVSADKGTWIARPQRQGSKPTFVHRLIYSFGSYQDVAVCRHAAHAARANFALKSALVVGVITGGAVHPCGRAVHERLRYRMS